MGIAVDRDQAFLAEIVRIADEVAARHASDVDREARFPHETLAALREARALSASLPSELGGDDVSFGALATACFELGRRCASSAMVFAMHQIQVVTIQRHYEPGSWFEEYLRRVASEQRLIASVTSEMGTGGDMGRSKAALTPDGELSTFVKQAPTCSYGNHADDFFATLRRTPVAPENDQVVVLALADQTTLEQQGTWDPLGMRGTCSAAFTVSARVDPGQALGAPFSVVMAESMVPVSHILWSHLWLGICQDAFDRARAFVRASAKRNPDTVGPVAQRLSHLSSKLALMRSEVAAGLADFPDDEDADGRARMSTMAQILYWNNLKIATSDHAPMLCQMAMSVCGIMGFKNDTPFSVGRHLRDAMSGCLMVANERLHETNAQLLLVAKEV